MLNFAYIVYLVPGCAIHKIILFGWVLIECPNYPDIQRFSPNTNLILMTIYEECRIITDVLPMPIIMIKTVIVNEMWSVSVNESTEGKAISPTGGHVTDLDSRIVIQLPPAPLLQSCHPHHI